MYECAVHFDALHLICHVFDFSHAFVILYLLVIDVIKNILNLKELESVKWNHRFMFVYDL